MPATRAAEGIARNPLFAQFGGSDATLLDLIRFLVDRDLNDQAEDALSRAGEPAVLDWDEVMSESPGTADEAPDLPLEAPRFDHADDHGAAAPKKFFLVEEASYDETSAFARPDHSGGGKKDSVDDDGSTTKGWGRFKTKPDDTTTTDPGTDTGGDTTDSTSGSDTTDTKTGSDSGTSDTPTSGTETNTGTTDPNTYVSGLDTPNGYNVEVVFLGSWTDYYKQAVYAAAEDISNLITMDLPTHNGIDDIRITAEIKSIDGSGGTWGWGGYSSVRSDSLLPSQGYTYFDSADIGTADSYGLWQDLVFHEMLHALGFGTAWSSMGLVDNYNGDLRFNGTNAVDAYNTNYSQIAANDPLSHLGVPIETDGGSGTAGKHWDDKTFVNEIMTPNLNFTNHISDMTLAALEDMGYETIYPDEEEEQQEFLYF